MEKPKEIFLVWQEPNVENDEEGYFTQYNSIKDAVENEGIEGNEVEIYMAEPKPIGKYKIQTKVVKQRARK